MNHADHLPKTHPVDDPAAVGDWGLAHWYCQACGADWRPLQNHHMIGGRGGRSDEPCNLLRVCGHPCHDLAGGLDVRVDAETMRNNGTLAGYWYMIEKFPGGLLPKLSLGMQVTMKLRAGELTAEDLARLEVLNLGPIELEVIPAWFIEKYERNRPESVACCPRVNYVHSWCRISPDSIKAIRPVGERR